jgi:HK97 family phage major capsid protein
MSEVVEAVADAMDALVGKAQEWRDARGDVLALIDDGVLAVMNGKPLVTPEQREYRQQFSKWLRNPEGEKSNMSQIVGDLHTKDMSIATNLSGGYGLPKQLAAQLESLARPACPLLNPDILGATEVNTNDYRVIIGRADTGVARTTETGTRSSTSTASFIERIPAWASYYGVVTISQAAREDRPDFDRFLMEEFAAQVGAQLMSDIVSGNGSGQVLGILNTSPVTTTDFASPMRAAAALEYQPLAGATVALADVNKLLKHFNGVYRTGGNFTFLMQPATWDTLWDVGNPTDAPFLQPQFLPQLRGHRVALSENMPAIGTNNFAIAAGDWKKGYALVTRGPAMLTIDEVTTVGVCKYHYRIRYGGCIRQSNALKLLKWATS